MLTKEVQTILLVQPNIQDWIEKAEIAYFCDNGKSDTIAMPDLLKLNKISNEAELENLMILLSDRVTSTGTVFELSTNADFLQMVTRDTTHKLTKKGHSNFTDRDQWLKRSC